MLRVAHIIDSLRIGGAQRLLVTFTQLAASHQVETKVISLFADKDMSMTAALRAGGAEVLTFPGRKLLSPDRIWRLVHYLRAARIDLVHTHLTYANVLGVLAARLAGKPSVATLHSTGHAAHRLHPIAEGLERSFLRIFTNRVIAVGNTVAEAYQPGLGKKKIVLIPNAVGEPAALAPEERLALRREIAGDPSRPILISIGRFIPAKAYEDLIAAFTRLHSTCPEVRLVIIGDGPLYPAIRERVQGQNLGAYVLLPGTRQDVARWLAAGDIYVSSSIWEGLPLAVLEAMMAGLPVVATAVGDIPWVVTPETGRVVPSQQPDRLAEAIGALLADPDTRCKMGAAAQAQARKNYSAAVWMDRLAGLYGELAPRPKPAGRTGFGSKRSYGRQPEEKGR